MHQRWCTRCDAPEVMHQRWCTRGDAPEMMHQMWCTRGDAPCKQKGRWYTPTRVECFPDLLGIFWSCLTRIGWLACKLEFSWKEAVQTFYLVAISSTLKRVFREIFKYPREIFKQGLNKTTQPCRVDLLMVCGKLTAPERNLDDVISKISWKEYNVKNSFFTNQCLYSLQPRKKSSSQH